MARALRTGQQGFGEDGGEWLPVSDLMAGLMMVFMAIAIFFMLRVEGIAYAYQDLQQQLYEELRVEFEADLEKWDALLEQSTLAIRFQEPEVLFDSGKAELKDEFKIILDDFFPRYVRIINGIQYKDHVTELRVEGHTSSEWNQGVSEEDAYFENMRLSQNRTRAVLQYTLTMEEVEASRDWLRERLTANGLSSSQVILDSDGLEDFAASRRVEFRVVTDAEIQLREIHSTLGRFAGRQ